MHSLLVVDSSASNPSYLSAAASLPKVVARCLSLGGLREHATLPIAGSVRKLTVATSHGLFGLSSFCFLHGA